MSADEISTLRAELYRAKRAVTEGRDLATKLEQERNQLAVQLNESQKQLAESHRSLEEAKKLSSVSSDLLSQVTALQSQLQRKDAEIAALQQQLEKETADRKRSEDSRVKLEAEKLAMQRRRDDLALRLAEAEQRAVSAEESEARVTSEVRGLEAERDALRDALERMSLASGSGAPSAAATAAAVQQAASAAAAQSAAELRNLESQLQQLELQLSRERSARESAELQLQAELQRQQQSGKGSAAAAEPAPVAPSAPSFSYALQPPSEMDRRLLELEEKLRKSNLARDRVLKEFEAAGEEVQRLHDENQRLVGEVGSLRQVIAAYDAQLMAALGKNQSKNATQQQNLILAAELLRTCLISGQVSRSGASVLSAVERRLLSIMAKSPSGMTAD